MVSWQPTAAARGSQLAVAGPPSTGTADGHGGRSRRRENPGSRWLLAPPSRRDPRYRGRTRPDGSASGGNLRTPLRRSQLVPPAGLEPALPAPEAGALSD